MLELLVILFLTSTKFYYSAVFINWDLGTMLIAVINKNCKVDIQKRILCLRKEFI